LYNNISSIKLPANCNQGYHHGATDGAEVSEIPMKLASQYSLISIYWPIKVVD